MSAPKMVSEREAVLRERAAYDAGVADVFRTARALGGIEHVDARKWADQIFPLPTIERPRVVPDPHGMNVVWSVKNGRISPRGSSAWGQRTVEHITPERVALWADLLANPTETVEDDGSLVESADHA